LLNDYFTVRATFNEFMHRLRAYGRAKPPPKLKELRFVIDEPLSVLDVEDGWRFVEQMDWFVTAYGVSRRPSDAPLFELRVKEAKDSCRVTMRCVEADAADWYDEMLDWLAPFGAGAGAARDEYPLPELPSTGATTKPPPVAPAPLPVSPAPAEKMPHVPRLPAHLRRWQAIWKKARPLAAEGKSNDYIVGWFAKHDDDLRPTKGLLIKIIAAGEKGLLD
jgi:hypothetical protein